jgi:hypothetical protein
LEAPHRQSTVAGLGARCAEDPFLQKTRTESKIVKIYESTIKKHQQQKHLPFAAFLAEDKGRALWS